MRAILVFFCLLFTLSSAGFCEEKKADPIPLPEMVIGDPNAPITLIEYSSLSCGFCAYFHEKVLPQIEEKYVKSGKVRILVRGLATDGPSLRGYQVAWCGGGLRYLDFISILFTDQEKWLFKKEPVKELEKIALKHGLSKTQFDSCIADEDLMNRIIFQREEDLKKYTLDATPTIIINGKIFPYAISFEEFEDIARPLLESEDKPEMKKVPSK